MGHQQLHFQNPSQFQSQQAYTQPSQYQQPQYQQHQFRQHQAPLNPYPPYHPHTGAAYARMPFTQPQGQRPSFNPAPPQQPHASITFVRPTTQTHSVKSEIKQPLTPFFQPGALDHINPNASYDSTFDPFLPASTSSSSNPPSSSTSITPSSSHAKIKSYTVEKTDMGYDYHRPSDDEQEYALTRYPDAPTQLNHLLQVSPCTCYISFGSCALVCVQICPHFFCIDVDFNDSRTDWVSWSPQVLRNRPSRAGCRDGFDHFFFLFDHFSLIFPFFSTVIK